MPPKKVRKTSSKSKAPSTAKRPRKGAKKGAKTARKVAAKPTKTAQPAAKPAKPTWSKRAAPAAIILEGDEVPLIVADSTIADGRTACRSRAPARVQVPLGSLLLVRHTFRIQESSPDKEAYIFALQARLGDHDKERIEERINDRPGLADDQIGFIQQRFRPREAGTYTLSFTAQTSYEVRGWASSKLLAAQQAECSGRVTVVVA